MQSSRRNATDWCRRYCEWKILSLRLVSRGMKFAKNQKSSLGEMFWHILLPNFKWRLGILVKLLLNKASFKTQNWRKQLVLKWNALARVRLTALVLGILETYSVLYISTPLLDAVAVKLVSWEFKISSTTIRNLITQPSWPFQVFVTPPHLPDGLQCS